MSDKRPPDDLNRIIDEMRADLDRAVKGLREAELVLAQGAPSNRARLSALRAVRAALPDPERER